MTQMPVRPSIAGLYAITDSQLLQGRLLEAVECALEGGAAIIQYRDKSADHRRRRTEAEALLALCRRYRRPLLINDDVELALAIGADGVHLGQQDQNLQKARARLGGQAIIGATCHDQLALAKAALADGASYIAFGAFFPSPTKPHARPAPLAVLHEARQRFDCPVVAIGGITLATAGDLLAAGASAVAVISDLWQATDISAHARAYAMLAQRHLESS